MIKVYCNSVREIGPRDHKGATSVIIGEEASQIYEGDALGAIGVLKSIPVGTSVAVRYPGGLRSCMNKPGLWADIEAMNIDD